MKTILSALLICFALLVQGQQPYTFSMHTSTYAPLTGATKHQTSWKAGEEFDMGFEFKFFDDKSQKTWIVGEPGVLSFSGGNDNDQIQVISAALSPNNTKSPTGIFYKVEGQSPNQIAKIEWRNVTVQTTSNNQVFANVQVWLHQTTNIIEMHIGPSQIDTQDLAPYGPTFSFQNKNQSFMFWLKGEAQNPDFIEHKQFVQKLTSYPSDGTVYRFSPPGVNPPSSVTELNLTKQVKLYPNPLSTNNKLTVEAKQAIQEITVTDIKGKSVFNVNAINENSYTTALNLKKGVYLVYTTTEKTTSVKKLTVY
jgi:hypothetical protein